MIVTPAARRQRLAQLLQREDFRSQSELADRLAAEGFGVTQATLSRDLLELGAIKTRTGSTMVYRLPGEDAAPSGAAELGMERLRRRCSEVLVSALPAGRLVVLRTPPGAANFLASAFDEAQPAGVVGTIAGDDTVFVAVAEQVTDAAIAALIDSLTSKQAATQPQKEST